MATSQLHLRLMTVTLVLAFSSSIAAEVPSVKSTVWTTDGSDTGCAQRGPTCVPNTRILEFRPDGSFTLYVVDLDGDRLPQLQSMTLIGTWTQDGVDVHIQGKSQYWSPDEHWTLSSDGRRIKWDDHLPPWTFKGRLPNGSETEKTPEKSIEFVNANSNSKVVEFRDGAAGTGDSCDTNDQLMSRKIDGNQSFVLACGAHVGFCFRWKADASDGDYGPWLGASCSDHLFDEKTKLKRVKF
jgi:hypothetical protein